MIDALKHIEGLFVGQLDPDELKLFNLCCEHGLAYRAYEGGAGLFGLAKVRLRQ